EGIDLVDEGLDPTELTVVGIEETGEDAHGSQEYRVGAPRSRSGTEGRRGVRRCDRARRAMARGPAAGLGLGPPPGAHTRPDRDVHGAHGRPADDSAGVVACDARVDDDP